MIEMVNTCLLQCNLIDRFNDIWHKCLPRSAKGCPSLNRSETVSARIGHQLQHMCVRANNAARKD